MLSQKKIDQMVAAASPEGYIYWRDPEGRLYIQREFGPDAARLFSGPGSSAVCVAVLTLDDTGFVYHDPNYNPYSSEA